jgi:multicopper oxidase/carboxypeptidase family protein
MSVTQPISKIPRWSVVGMEGMFTKMWDPPTESPVTPDELLPTNPVPEVMAAAGMASAPVAPHTMQFDLLHSLAIPTWDGLKTLNFYTIISPDIPATLNGVYPGVTLRMPCGVVFHGATAGKGPPPHTIHWHGIEPTPMNDGVGHCSMELGKYTYQWQPSFIGTYFYHCHRNTMQHFEFGLFGLMIFEPADTYFATQVDPAIPIGHCRDGKRRTGANLVHFPQFPGWVGGLRTDPDPWTGNPALKMQNLNPQLGNINPHAQTVPYDVEAIWVFDDRDSNWSDLAPGAHTAFPAHGPHPGFDDNFARNPGVNGFLAFNDYGADYWFVTGVPVPAHRGEIGTIPAGIVIPPELNSGISGSQVSVQAQVGQTILIRVLDAAYNNCRYTFPVDVVIIEWDGRPLGVPPYGFNEAYLVPAGAPIEVAVGRRFGALVRATAPLQSFAICEFIDTRGANVNGFEVVTVTAKVPFNIGGTAIPVTFNATGKVTDQTGKPIAGASVTVAPATLGGTASQTVVTDVAGNFGVGGLSSASYSISASLNGATFTPPVKTVTIIDQSLVGQNFVASLDVNAVTITTDKTSPQKAGFPVIFTAAVAGGTGTYDFQFSVNGVVKQAFSANKTFTLDTATVEPGILKVQVNVRLAGAVLALGEKTGSMKFAVEPLSSTATLTPGSYTIQEALDALQMAVGAKNPTEANKLRMDVMPMLNGAMRPDGKIDVQDVVAILRMAVGLPL